MRDTCALNTLEETNLPSRLKVWGFGRPDLPLGRGLCHQLSSSHEPWHTGPVLNVVYCVFGRTCGGDMRLCLLCAWGCFGGFCVCLGY